MNSITEQQKQKELLTEESLANMMYEKLNDAYRKGYNNACDVFSEVLLSHSAEFGDPKIKLVIEGLALTIKDCKLKEDDIRLNG